MIGDIKRRRIQKSNEDGNKTGRITKQNQRQIMDTNKEALKKPTANNSQEIIATGTTGAGTTTSNDTNLGAGETHWVNIRQWDKSGGRMKATIGEIRKAIDDEFNNNVRRFMLSKPSEPRMTVNPQQKRTVRISKKWTEPAKTRLLIPPKQMDSKRTSIPA